MMAALDEAFLRAWSTFKIPGFNSYQKLAIEKFVIQKQDVLVNLPTGSGKSLIYQALPGSKPTTSPKKHVGRQI